MFIMMNFVKSTFSLLWKIHHPFNNERTLNTLFPWMLQLRAPQDAEEGHKWELCTSMIQHLIHLSIAKAQNPVIHSWRGPQDITHSLFSHKPDIFDHWTSQTPEIWSWRNFQEPTVLLRAVSVYTWQPSMLPCIVVPNISLKVSKEKSYWLVLQQSD